MPEAPGERPRQLLAEGAGDRPADAEDAAGSAGSETSGGDAQVAATEQLDADREQDDPDARAPRARPGQS